MTGAAGAQRAALSEPQRPFVRATNESSQGSKRERGALRDRRAAIVVLQVLWMGKSGVKKRVCVFSELGGASGAQKSDLVVTDSGVVPLRR